MPRSRGLSIQALYAAAALLWCGTTASLPRAAHADGEREFKQFEEEHYRVDIHKLRHSPDGHALHFIQDASDTIFTWDAKRSQYVHHDTDKHHHKETGHHHKTVFDFDHEEGPPKELQHDDEGHPLIEIVNLRDHTRWVWMYADGNYHDADMNIMQDDPIIQHEIRTGEYVAPHLGYHPYTGPYVTKMLMDAVRAGDYKEIMRIFQTTRVDPNAQDEDGNTALHIAHEYAMVQIICLLGTHHADFHIKNNRGLTPYMLFEEAFKENRGEPWLATLRETLGDDIIRANYRFSPYSQHEHWEPGAVFDSDNPDEWHPSKGTYHHHVPGQPVGMGEPDKLDL